MIHCLGILYPVEPYINENHDPFYKVLIISLILIIVCVFFCLLYLFLEKLIMPDITLCRNFMCPKRKNCYRYMAVPCRLQTYAIFPDKDCEYFYAIPEGYPLRTVVEESRELPEDPV